MKKALKQIIGILLCLVILGGNYLFMHRNVDSQAPEISIPDGELSISVQDDLSVLLTGATAWDDRDGDVTELMLVESAGALTDDFTSTVTLAAFDRSGNVAKATRRVRYTDYDGMKFEITAPLVFAYGRNFDILTYIKVTDPLDGDISSRIKANLVGDDTSIRNAGHHEVALRVTNSMGYTARLTIPVDVCEPSVFNAALQLSQYILYLQKGQAFRPNTYAKWLVADNYQKFPLDSSRDRDTVLTVESDVNTDVPGVYTVRYTAEHGSYTGFSNLIVIVED